ncbi:MAG: hypothetical protein RLP12_17335, partial [Ekhidna sp.]
MKNFQITLLYLISLVSIFLSNVSLAQAEIENMYDENSEQTIFRQAGDYSQKHDVVTIAVLRGTHERELYDRVVAVLSSKLD